jgi:hypothetical protein
MSGIKRIAVHVEGGTHDGPVLRLSAALATRFGAGLEAVFANVPPFIPASIDGLLTPQIIEAQQAIYRKRADAAKAALAGIALPQGKPVWTQVDALPSVVVIARGRYADLAVLAQPSPEETDVATDYDAPAEIVMSLGRPVLMVPYAGTFIDPNAFSSRGAARASPRVRWLMRYRSWSARLRSRSLLSIPRPTRP